jgi:hypothetical protein
MASEKGDLRAERIQDTLPHLDNKGAKRIKAGNLLSVLFAGKCAGRNIANGNFLRAAIKALWQLGPVTK